MRDVGGLVCAVTSKLSSFNEESLLCESRNFSSPFLPKFNANEGMDGNAWYERVTMHMNSVISANHIQFIGDFSSSVHTKRLEKFLWIYKNDQSILRFKAFYICIETTVKKWNTWFYVVRITNYFNEESINICNHFVTFSFYILAFANLFLVYKSIGSNSIKWNFKKKT